MNSFNDSKNEYLEKGLARMNSFNDSKNEYLEKGLARMNSFNDSKNEYIDVPRGMVAIDLNRFEELLVAETQLETVQRIVAETPSWILAERIAAALPSVVLPAQKKSEQKGIDLCADGQPDHHEN
jgi:hypothetical protein